MNKNELNKTNFFYLKYFYRKLFYFPKLKINLKKNIIKMNIDNITFKFLNSYKKKLLSSFFELKYLLPQYLKYYKIKKGDYIFDIGSAEGEFAVFASKKVGKKGKIIIFEPHPIYCKIIEENMKLNNCTNYVLIKKGLYNKNKKIGFDFDDEGSLIKNNNKNIIEVVKLDDFIKNEKIDINKISFIKMDIEGAEIEAIEGMKNILKYGKPKMAIACYHFRNDLKGITAGYLVKTFTKLGYNIFLDYPEHLTAHINKINL